MMPSRKPGQFSTSVVSISCPPASSPSITRGCKLARAVYSAAVSPAGPEPMMMTSRCGEDMSAVGSATSDVSVDHLFQGILVGKPDHLLDKLPALEEQERGDASDTESHWCSRVLEIGRAHV